MLIKIIRFVFQLIRNLKRVFRFIFHPIKVSKRFLKSFDLVVTKILWQICVPIASKAPSSIHVDLGSGRFPRNPFGASIVVGTDLHSDFISEEGVEFIQVDLTKKLPFEDSSIDTFSAYDVLEHIPRWERYENNIEFPFINLMNEIYRCLKPGGTFLGVTPCFPSKVAFQDPTHVNFISTSTVEYFVGPNPGAKDLKYGFEGNFNLICQAWIHGLAVMSRKSDALNLGNKSEFQRIKYVLRVSNLMPLLKVARNVLTEKPSHLLWVLAKPLQS